MKAEKKSREEIIEQYKYEVQNLSKYIPWLQKQSADMVASMYRGAGTNQSFTFPVYNSTLLAFINDVGMTSFMDTNYQYVYSRYRIRTHEDEWRVIDKVDIMNMDVLGGIISKYVLGGMTRAKLWKEGVQYEIFLRVLVKAKEIIEFWDKPLEVSGEYLLDEAESQNEIYEEAAYAEDTYTEDTYTEDTYTEDAYGEQTYEAEGYAEEVAMDAESYTSEESALEVESYTSGETALEVESYTSGETALEVESYTSEETVSEVEEVNEDEILEADEEANEEIVAEVLESNDDECEESTLEDVSVEEMMLEVEHIQNEDEITEETEEAYMAQEALIEDEMLAADEEANEEIVSEVLEEDVNIQDESASDEEMTS